MISDMDFVFYFTILCFILIFSSMINFVDFDFWARLIVGKTFFQTGQLFNNDFYSYGLTHQFVDHEWGSSLIFYLLQEKTGDFGLFVFKSLIIFFTIFILTKIIRLKDKNIKLNFLFFFFALQAISYNIFSTIRCQTFSFFFFVFYLLILEKTRYDKNYRILYLIPLLNIVWQNMHGGFVVGIFILFLYGLGEFLNKKTYKPYFLTLIATLATTLINPYGIKYLTYIFDAFSLNRKYIPEWHSAFFSTNIPYTMIKFKIFFIIAILLILFAIIKAIKTVGFREYFKNLDKTKYLIILFCLAISIKSLRCHPFLVYSLCAFCYVDFYNIFNKKLPEKIDNLKAIALMVLVFVSTVSHLTTFKFINQISPFEYPIYCVEFLKQNNIKGNVFTTFHSGSYVIYKLFPNNFIYMDGRYEETYDNSLIDDMADFLLDEHKNDFIKKYHTDIFIIEKHYPIYKKMLANGAYFKVYEDETFALFLDNKYKNKNINKSFKTPTKDKNYYNLTKYDTNITFD